MPHLLNCHKSITTLNGEDIVFLATDINLPGAVDWYVYNTLTKLYPNPIYHLLNTVLIYIIVFNYCFTILGL